MTIMKRLTTEGIVLHRAEVYTGDDYHFLVMRDGTVKALVPPDCVAFHACRFNQTTIAIATYGDFASKEPGLNWHPTKVQIARVKGLIESLCTQYPSIKWISGHSNLGPSGTAIPKKLIPGHTCPGENFPLDEMIVASGLAPLPPPRKSPTLAV